MKRIRLFVIVILLIVISKDIGFTQTKILKKNIEKFSLSAYTATIDNSDSLRISVFMQIPYGTLQYVKSDSQFIARYEATIAVQKIVFPFFPFGIVGDDIQGLEFRFYGR